MNRLIKIIITLVALLAMQGAASAEMRKLTYSEMKNAKAQTGIIETMNEASEEIFFSRTTDSSEFRNSLNEVVKGFDILVSDRNGKWERKGNSTYENGVINLDETIYTGGLSYENIRLNGAGEDVKSFGSVHIGEARYEIKGQIKITFRPN